MKIPSHGKLLPWRHLSHFTAGSAAAEAKVRLLPVAAAFDPAYDEAEQSGPGTAERKAPMARILPILALLIVAVPAVAEVVDVAESGFTSHNEITVNAAPDLVWSALTGSVGQWWHPDHTWSGDAANLTMDPRAGGMFSENLPDGGSVEHMRVLYADSGRLLRLGGGLGPLQGMAVTGVLTVEFAATESGTGLTVTYTVGGYAVGGLQGIAGPVDGVVRQQFERLKAFIEG